MILRLQSTAMAVALSAMLAACPGPESDAQRGGDDQTVPAAVRTAAEIAAAIDANPSAAESILTARGLSVEELDSLMYVIAADPVLSEDFESARR